MKIRNSNLRAGRWRRVRQRLQNSSGKRITGMADPGSHKVDTHSVKMVSVQDMDSEAMSPMRESVP